LYFLRARRLPRRIHLSRIFKRRVLMALEVMRFELALENLAAKHQAEHRCRHYRRPRLQECRIVKG
jgi:hypothetical protein